MKPREFCAVPRDRMIDSLPPGHPAAEENRLTLFQQQALPTLMWFFDLARNRATGRSTLMAYVVIELAMRGHTVPVEDPSSMLIGAPTRMHGWFKELVLRLVHTEFPHDIFYYDHGRNILEYRGRKPHGQSYRNV